MKQENNILVAKEKRSLSRPRIRWEDNSKSENKVKSLCLFTYRAVKV
jgi:hypothetical protein